MGLHLHDCFKSCCHVKCKIANWWILPSGEFSICCPYNQNKVDPKVWNVYQKVLQACLFVQVSREKVHQSIQYIEILFPTYYDIYIICGIVLEQCFNLSLFSNHEEKILKRIKILCPQDIRVWFFSFFDIHQCQVFVERCQFQIFQIFFNVYQRSPKLQMGVFFVSKVCSSLNTSQQNLINIWSHCFCGCKKITNRTRENPF